MNCVLDIEIFRSIQHKHIAFADWITIDNNLIPRLVFEGDYLLLDSQHICLRSIIAYVI